MQMIMILIFETTETYLSLVSNVSTKFFLRSAALCPVFLTRKPQTVALRSGCLRFLQLHSLEPYRCELR